MLGCMHVVDALYVSASLLSAFRAAIVGSVWSCEMPVPNTPVILNLLDGHVGVDPAFHIVWTRFRLIRRYLAHRPLEVSGISACWIWLHMGPPGPGPVHLLLISVAEIGFAWDGE